MRIYPELYILAEHTDMYVSDVEKDILIALDNATPEVRQAIESLNAKRKKNK